MARMEDDLGDAYTEPAADVRGYIEYVKSQKCAERPAPVSHICQAYPDRVEVRGRDLAGDLMGRVTFTEYFHLLLTGREPTDDQRFFLDLLLVGIAEHGMMPSERRRADDARRRSRVAPGRGRGGDPRLRAGPARYLRGLRPAAREAQARSPQGGDPAAVADELARAIHDVRREDPGLRPSGAQAARPACRADPRARRRACA